MTEKNGGSEGKGTDRNDLDLFELVCQLSIRYTLHQNEKMHLAFFEAKNEMIKRLSENAALKKELKESEYRNFAMSADLSLYQNEVDRLKKRWPGLNKDDHMLFAQIMIDYSRGVQNGGHPLDIAIGLIDNIYKANINNY